RFSRDWSSDVCSSDLGLTESILNIRLGGRLSGYCLQLPSGLVITTGFVVAGSMGNGFAHHFQILLFFEFPGFFLFGEGKLSGFRSEERRVGKRPGRRP